MNTIITILTLQRPYPSNFQI